MIVLQIFLFAGEGVCELDDLRGCSSMIYM